MAKPPTKPTPEPPTSPENPVETICPRCQQAILDPDSPKRRLVGVARSTSNEGAADFRRMIDEMDAEELTVALRLLDAEMGSPSHPTAAQRASVIKSLVLRRLHVLEAMEE